MKTVPGPMIIAFVPLALINIALIVLCLRDWINREHFQYLSKWAWLPIFVLIQFIGPTLYLMIGRSNDDR